LKFDELVDGCERQVFKTLDLDLRVFKNIEMFVHAEERNSNITALQIPDGAVKLFLRLGSDFKSNYYEFEIPLVMSRNPDLTGDEYENSGARKIILSLPWRNSPISRLPEMRLWCQ
jgi:cell surface protein SprA